MPIDLDDLKAEIKRIKMRKISDAENAALFGELDIPETDVTIKQSSSSETCEAQLRKNSD